MNLLKALLLAIGVVLLFINTTLLALGIFYPAIYVPVEDDVGRTPWPGPTTTSSLTPNFVEETGTPEPLLTKTPRRPTPTITPRPPTPTLAVYDPCACDWDFDGDIDIVDIQALAAQWGTVGCDDSPVLWYGTPEF